MDRTFFEQETNEIILYIAQKVENMYNILKIIYYANQEHLLKYGCFITNDIHYALEDGQIPSIAFDLIKFFRDGKKAFKKFNIKKNFDVEKTYIIKPKRGPDMNYISETAIECLDKAIEKIGKLSIIELKKLTQQDKAYINTPKNNIITQMKIAEYSPNKKMLTEYLSMK